MISIQDCGAKTWNYNDCLYWSEGIKKFFDVFIAYGNGAEPHWKDTWVLDLLKSPKVVENTIDLDFVVVMINMHDQAKEYI